MSRTIGRAMRHWLLGLNVSLACYLLGAIAAPVLAAGGWSATAETLYKVYHLACHQWAFRTFFLFGPQPIAIYNQAELVGRGLDPFQFVGDQALGYKMAFCERDLAIYLGLLLIGVLYARRRDMQPLGFLPYAVLILPMAVDGFSQLFGWRESTWQLRLVTGLLFGTASGWLVLPRLDPAFGLSGESTSYAPQNACEPRLPVSPIAPLPPRG